MVVELGLGRIARLVQHTPLKWKAIHVAGTNGKGSITAYMSAILAAAGVRTGRFNSPHLIDRWDCISIQNRPVSRDIFSHVEREINSHNEKFGIHASEFELLTSTAFEIFNLSHVQVGVVEVGLGGRLDATNILGHEDVLVSVISKIGLDHQALLGSSIGAIAREKAGIMKHGVPCVVDGTNSPTALDVIYEQAVLAGTKVSEVTPEADSETMKLLEPYIEDLNMAPHQINNLLVAVKALQTAEPCLELTEPMLYSLSAIRTMLWPGRLQQVSLEPLLGQNVNALLDGAHNPQAADVLSAYVDHRVRQNSDPVTWVLAATEGKDVAQLVRHMVQPQDMVIATQFGPVDGMPWVKSVDPEQITRAASSICNVKAPLRIPDIGPALQSLLDLKNPSVVIAGSLYLVSDVLRLLRSKSGHPTSVETD